MADVMYLDFFLAKSKFRRTLIEFKRIFTVLVIFIVVIDSTSASSCSKDSDCDRGTCESRSCVCDHGWGGDKCDHCGGRVKLDSPSGYIIDGVEHYKESIECTWLIDSRQPGSLIRLKFEQFETECAWDYLYIYDGDSVYDPLIATFSGLLVSENEENVTYPEVTTSSGFAYLHFYSDAALSMAGFNISYSVNTCTRDCSGNGICLESPVECDCDPRWTGEGCNIRECPNDCGNHGDCNLAIMRCQCNDGYKGHGCEVPPTSGSWEVDIDKFSQGRASHATVLQDSVVWIVGGYPFTNQANYEDIIITFDIEAGPPTPKIPVSSLNPESRYGHSVVLDRDRLIMYGGTVTATQQNKVVNELWFFNITTESWEFYDIATESRIAVDGHTAHMVYKTMIVIFGYSPKHGYTNVVQEFDTVSGVWSVVKTNGVNVNGGYGHSSVYDENHGLIYVYGGFKAIMERKGYLSDELYSYAPIGRHWSVLQSSGHRVYLHSAVMMGGMMYVFSGNPHNDTHSSSDARCFSTTLLAYDLRCGTWSVVPIENGIYTDINRYGHTAVRYGNKMYIISGYNNIMLTDVPIYTPGDCTAFLDKKSCFAGSTGISCVWLTSDDKCDSLDSVSENSLYELQHCPEPKESTQCAYKTKCNECVLTHGCGWCGAQCSANCGSAVNLQVGTVCTGNDYPCEKFYTCDSCKLYLEQCVWNGSSCTMRGEGDGNGTKCDASCADMTDCVTCSNENCMWCSNTQSCVDKNSYVTSFPYGQCMSWHNKASDCPGSGCSQYRTCDECHENPSCGWCDDGSNTGLGTCMEGSYSQPEQGNSCREKRWFFIGCPACQCNGHSQCINQTICESCEDNTQGKHCGGCSEGYYGDPTNGGNCSACFCNGHSDTCDSTSGVCACRSKGITGKECDKCEESRKYFGDPTSNGTCYYELLLNYEFTFNLTRDEDKHITAINFKCVINKGNRDIDFNLRADKPCSFMIFFTSRSNPVETLLVKKSMVKKFKMVFTRKEFNFNAIENTTFYVYLSNFTTPFWFQISFSWRAVMMLDLLQFFVTFFSCFLSLLLIAAIVWKIKQRYDTYIRRRAHIVEMAHLASRPFATCCLELEREEAPADNSPSKPKGPSSAIAIEPCRGGRAAILNLFVRLPASGGGYSPADYNGLALGSALVQVNTKRHTDNKDKGSMRQRKQQHQRSIANGGNCV
ncbi:attractin-like protein 1 [Glandiceps talaboti]